MLVIQFFLYFRPQLIVASVNAALLLFTHLTAKLTHYNKQYLEVLIVSMTIILLSLSKLDQSASDENKDVLDKAILMLKSWIINENVIGGSLFGGRVVGENLVHSENELEVNVSSVAYTGPAYGNKWCHEQDGICLLREKIWIM